MMHHKTITVSEYCRFLKHSGPGCSKLTTLLVNVSLKFQMFMSQICQYFLMKKYEKLFFSSPEPKAPGELIV